MKQETRSLLADAAAVVIAVGVLPLAAGAITKPFLDDCATSMERFAAGYYAWVPLVALVAFATQRTAGATWSRAAGSAIVGAAFALMFSVVAPNLDFGDVDRGKLKRTGGDMRVIAMGLEEHRKKHGEYPRTSSVDELKPLLDVRRLPTVDGWGRAYAIRVESQHYSVLSLGSCGALSTPDASASPFALKQPLLLEDGEFVRYPGSGRAVPSDAR